MVERWQMNKLGFVNFWLYDWEEFTFSHGRLLLRGENGAGKSITTQSFIPFMLDGDMRPYRLDSFGSKDRKMDYYLLGSDKEESTGYLYLEFVKPQHKLYRTFVVGLRARRGKPMDFWGFCLSDGRRIGTGEGDFSLFSTHGAQHMVLTRQEARNRFGEGENWVEKSSEYKQMVNRMLFGWQEMEQYDRLLKLLMDIRKPKLSKDFSPNLVRDILNESLQPLGEEDIAPMIQSMEKMDDIQNRLESLKASFDAARKLSREYKRYNTFVLGRKGDFYLQARQEAACLVQKAEALGQQLSDAETSLKEQHAKKQAAIQLYSEKKSEYDILHQNDELEKTVEKLDSQRADLDQAQCELNQKRQLETKKQRECDAKESELQNARLRWADQQAALEANFAQLEEMNAQLEYPGHPACLDALDYSLQRGELDQYLQQLWQGHSLLRQQQDVQDELDTAEQQRDQAAANLRHGQEQLARAEAMVTQERGELCEAFSGLEDKSLAFWLTEQDLRELFQLIDAYAGIAQDQAIVEKLSARLQRLSAPLQSQSAALEQTLRLLQGELNELGRQKKELEAQKELSPDRKPAVEATRSLLREKGIPHASFYELVDFAPDLPEEQRALLEAQLLDAGILDALVVPPEAHDALCELLQNHPDQFLCLEDVCEETVSLPLCAEPGAPAWADPETLLKRIGCRPGSATWFAVDGSYRQGILKGHSVPDSPARYIGASPRKANRARQIQQLENLIQEKSGEIHQAQQQLTQCKETLARLNQEYTQRPTTANLATALQLFDTESARVARLEQELENKNDRVYTWQRRLSDLRAQFLTRTKGLRYEQTLETYQQILSLFEDYKEAFSDLFRDKQKLENTRNFIGNLQLTLDTLQDALVDCTDQIRRIEATCRQLQRTIDALEEYLARPETKERARKLETLRQEMQQARQQQQDAELAIVKLEETLRHLRPQKQQKSEEAQRAIEQEEHKRSIFEEELRLGPGQPGLGEGSLWQQAEQAKNALLHLSPPLNPQLTHEDMRTSLEKHLRSADALNLYHIELHSLFASEEGQLRSRTGIVLYENGQRLDLLDFLQHIQDRIEADRQLLSQEDRRLFETILNQTVTIKLSHRINDSEEWVKNMSSIMEQLVSSMGMRFSLAWKGKPADQADQLATTELVQLLRKDPLVMGDTDREKIAAHFRSRIETARRQSHSGVTPATYSELMRQALDFRNWFEFHIYFQRGDQSKKELTNSAFNSFSGGEKAMAMYIPLFAALSAQYIAAEKDAPRLMALDEAFAGVDETNIESMFSLVEQLDMDYIMNSQALWGCYPSVKALNIAELWRPQGAQVVTILRYHWNGRVKELAEL